MIINGKMLVIFFGKTGAGKDYTAEILAKEFGFYHYDADSDLTAEMREAITNGLVFGDAMRSKYLEIVIEKTHKLLNVNLKVALTQGLFKNKHRWELMKAFPLAIFIWVDADDNTIEQRILERSSMVTLEYAHRINPLFETPDFRCEKIINNGGLEKLLNDVKKIGMKLEDMIKLI